MLGPRIVELEAMPLLGCSFYGNPFAVNGEWNTDNEIGLLWKRFMREWGEHGALLDGLRTDDTCIELHLEGTDAAALGLFEVFAGLPVRNLETVPPAFVGKVLPAGRYAVFTLEGAEITEEHQAEVTARLEALHERLQRGFAFQRYDERFLGMERIDESQLDVYYPLVSDDRA